MHLMDMKTIQYQWLVYNDESPPSEQQMYEEEKKSEMIKLLGFLIL